MPQSARSVFRVAVLACIFLPNTGLAAGEPSYPTQYVATVWRTEQGLPQNSINAMLQDHRGYLWIGTFGGLARFDGDRFTIFTSADTPGFSSARIRDESRSSYGSPRRALANCGTIAPSIRVGAMQGSLAIFARR